MPRAKPGPGDAADELSYLRAYDPSAFERPSVTVDVVLLAPAEGGLRTILVRRDEHPFLGCWALPGGFIRLEESFEAAAARILKTKTGLAKPYLEQLYTFGEPRRDPRTRVITVAYSALVDARRFQGADLAAGGTTVARLEVPWKHAEGGPVRALDGSGKPLPLAFDHASILGMAVQRLRGKLDYSLLAFELLPPLFTLYELQKVHEAVLGRRLNKDSFRRRLLATGDLAATGRLQEDVGHRPAELYRWLKTKR